MRIALLADAGSIHARRWAEGLAGRGHVVALWSERDWPGAVPRGVLVHRLAPLASARRGMAANLVAIRRGVAAFGPDVVHAHYASHYGLYGALLGAQPLVISVWGADVEVFPQERPALHRPLLAWIFRRARAVTATSRHLARVAQGLGARAVAVIPFGVDRTRFFPVPPNPPGTPLRWVINKALEPVYGIDFLLEVLASLEPGLEWEGRIAGGGSQAQRLRQLAAARGLSSRIEWLGPVASDRLPEVLAWADVGLYPSWRESFGVAPLECMALGRAVVGHRVGGLPEVIRDGETGWLVEIGDRAGWAALLRALASDPAVARARGAAGPRWVAEAYDWEASLDQMEALYRRVSRSDGQEPGRESG
ncbi:MAG: glycosyltransferase [Firmicutes bacterium]|nr:glycosyltransferase [Alicyclobacillaceae bacterium]MCL6497258.1 glycosyltransferase [Bacillota bacterium]